jgi:hypothetical protein
MTSEKSKTKKRCISGCKFLSRDICKRSTRCKFIDGMSRKYCRLSSQYKMKPSTCKIIKKTYKKEARKKIGQYIMKIIDSNNERKAEYLKAICSDSGACIAFGNNREKISKFFGNFKNFHYVDPPIKRLGKPSNNGFVREVKYKRNEYIAYAVLKSSADETSDNLAYEYLVGQFINEQCAKYYPCFLETYGLFYYNSDVNWKYMRDTISIGLNVLKDVLIPGDPTDYSKICSNSKYAAILIQHLKDAPTINDFLRMTGRQSIKKVCYELLYILYQVYMPLAQLKNNFTHYDLHDGNVLIYEPVKGKYIEYHYSVGNGKMINFKSPYIVKIIDYGRSFFKYKGTNSGQLNSSDIYKKLCQEGSCNIGNQVCGKDYGFEWMEGPLSNENFFISSQYLNNSHDLRLLYVLNDVIERLKRHVDGYCNPNEKMAFNTIKTLIKSVKYGMGIKKGENRMYGTNINKKMGYPNSINNIMDAEKCLREIILNDETIYEMNEQNYKPENKIGDMYIYVDGSPMRFEPV